LTFSDIILLSLSLQFRQCCVCVLWLRANKKLTIWTQKYLTWFFFFYQLSLKQLSVYIYQAITVNSKTLPKVRMHWNVCVFCEMSTNTAVTIKRLLALSPLSAWSKMTDNFIHKLITNNRKTDKADMPYCTACWVLSVSIVYGFWYRVTVDVCEWNVKINTNLVSFETLKCWLVSYWKYILQYKTKYKYFQQQQQQHSFITDSRETPYKNN
jgi:hypothetical protein